MTPSPSPAPEKKPPTLLERLKAKPGDEISAIGEKIEESEALRKPFETTWSIVRSRYLGQGRPRVVDGKVRKPTKARKGRPRISINELLPRARSIVAALTANKPRPQAVPADEKDDKAIAAARLGEKVLSGLTHQLGQPRKVRRALLSAVLYGKGFLRAGWDASKGPQVERRRCSACGVIDDEAQVPADLVAAAMQKMGYAPEVPEGVDPAVAQSAMAKLMASSMCPGCGLEVEVVKFSQGDFVLNDITPWQILPDPSALTLSDAAWVVIENHLSVGEAEARWPGKTFESEEIELGYDFLGGLEATEVDRLPKRKVVRVFEYLEQKTPQYPLGVRVVFTRVPAMVLDSSDQISPDGLYPIGEIVADETLERFWAKGLLEDTVVLNDEEDKTLGALLKMRELAADPPILDPGNLDVQEESHLATPGRRIKYRPTGGPAPEFMKPPIVSPVFSNLLAFFADRQDFIAQQYAPFRGQPGSQVTSGLQARLLVERAATALSAVSLSLEETVARVGKVLILEAQAHMPEERLLAFAGEHGKPETVRFRGTDLVGVADVIVVTGSSFPESKEARRDFYLSLLKSGLGPEEKSKVLEQLDSGISVPENPLDVVRRKARDESDRILRGELVEVEDGDFHEIEIGTHALFESSEAFVRASPDRKAAHRAHREGHEEALLEDVVKERMKAAAVEMATAELGADSPQVPPPGRGAAGPSPAEIAAAGGIQ